MRRIWNGLVVAAFMVVAAGGLPVHGVAESCIVSGNADRTCAESAWQIVAEFDSWLEEYAWMVFDPFRLDGRRGMCILFR